jgi:NarL family two-component system response regulator LiaR
MKSANRIRVLIVDDHSLVRGGLQFFLATTDDIEVIGEAHDGEGALRMCERYRPDVVLMDLKMPIMNGVEATRLIRQRYPDTSVIALTSFHEDELILRALQAGAISYLLKDIPADELGDAIRAAHAGHPTLAPEVTQKLVQAIAGPPKLGHDLTERELEVLHLLAMGLSNAAIAAQLSLSRNTVRHHVRSILLKLDASNRTEAVVLALQHGLVHDDQP